MGFLWGSAGKELPAMWETWVQSLSWEDPLEKGTAYPLQYSGLENSMDCIVHGVAIIIKQTPVSLRIKCHYCKGQIIVTK